MVFPCELGSRRHRNKFGDAYALQSSSVPLQRPKRHPGALVLRGYLKYILRGCGIFYLGRLILMPQFITNDWWQNEIPDNQLAYEKKWVDLTWTVHGNKKYVAGPLEAYFRENHYNASGKEGKLFFQQGCPIWREEAASPKYQELQSYIKELRQYIEAVENFHVSTNLRTELLQRGPEARDEICSRVELDKAGLSGIFKSNQLSFSPLVGYMEPLLPPLRHPLLCYDNPNIYNYYLGANRLLDLSYLVHHFGALCRQLRPDSRIVLIDMGASLQFHDSYSSKAMPAVYLTEIFQKFGMPFDHIYAYEITPTEPDIMVKSIPEQLRASYHWINVAVDTDEKSVNNPLNLIHNHFNQHDIVIVKLDIDNDRIEQQFIQQLLQDERFHALSDNSTNTKALIDHFYFEHHLSGNFERKESIKLFTQLREKGVSAHYWV